MLLARYPLGNNDRITLFARRLDSLMQNERQNSIMPLPFPNRKMIDFILIFLK